MQVKKQQLELDSSTVRTGFKLAKEYVKAAFYHSAYLTYMQSTWREMQGWMMHKLEWIVCWNCVPSCSVVSDSLQPMVWGPPGFLSMGILQARMEWVAMPSFRGSSQPRDRTQVSWAGRVFTLWATREWRFLGEISTASDMQMILP